MATAFFFTLCQTKNERIYVDIPFAPTVKSSIFGLLLLVVNLLLVVLAAYLAIRNFRNRSRGAPLLEGMEQHFFLSHYQLNSGDQCDALEKELRDRTFKVWYDNKADDLTELGMKAGVDKSEVFLLFLNSHTLSRCKKSLTRNIPHSRASLCAIALPIFELCFFVVVLASYRRTNFFLLFLCYFHVPRVCAIGAPRSAPAEKAHGSHS